LTAEPVHTTISYSSLPANIVVRVRMSSSDVVALAKSEFAGRFVEQQAAFNPKGEELIESNGSYFRRVTLEYVEYSSAGMHGACTQQVFVWFSPEGSHTGTYAQEALCPV